MKFVLIAFLLSLCGLVFAQEVPPVMTDEAFIQLLIQSLGGLKGVGALGIAAIVVKLLLAAFNTPFLGKQLDKLTGKMKLTLVSVLAYISGVLALHISGLSLGAAFVHSSVMPLLVVFLNQVYKQFIQKADEPPKA